MPEAYMPSIPTAMRMHLYLAHALYTNVECATRNSKGHEGHQASCISDRTCENVLHILHFKCLALSLHSLATCILEADGKSFENPNMGNSFVFWGHETRMRLL